MSTPPSVEAILAGAKNTLTEANKFSASLPKTNNEYSNAPYKMAHQASKPKATDGKEAESIVSGLKWKSEQKKALDQ